MPVPKQEDVKAVLADFEARLRAVVDLAWQEWGAQPNKGRFVFLPRVRAVMVFDFIARHALAEFDKDPNIRVIPKGQQTLHFLFRDRIIVRFKKGNAKGVGSNVRTQAVLDFIDPQRLIPGLVPDIMKVEICYSHDSIGLEIAEVAVVARNHTKRIWAYPLGRGEPSGGIIELPPRAPDPTPPVVLPRQPVPGEKTEEDE